MANLIKAELYKLKKNFYIWIVLFIMILCYLPSLFGSTADSFESILSGIQRDIMVIQVALSIYSGLTISNDFGNRTIMHYISGGHKRSDILLAEFLSLYISCILIITLYPTIVLILCSFILDFSFLSSIGVLIYSLIQTVILYSGLIGMYFLVSIITKKGTVSMGISFTLSILITVLSNRLYDDSNSLWRLNPLMQFQNIGSFSLGLLMSGLLSLLLLFIFLIVSAKLFDHTEIR